MPSLALQSFDGWTNQQVAAIQGARPDITNTAPGSVVRALTEANSGVALWVQWLVVIVLATTRAATSNGADLDTWTADFSFTRLPAVAASGSVTFSRFSAGTAALIVPYLNADGSTNTAGAQAMTADQTETFSVTTDTTNGLWNAAQGGYLVPSGTASATVPVQAAVAGTGGNVAASTITLMTTAISGIDTVTNAAAFTNGIDEESDPAVRARFTLYINSLSKATKAAVGNAILGVQQGLTYTIQENINPSGVYTPGTFVVTVDNGTGAPPSALLTAVQTAVDAVRPLGSSYTVQGPSVVNASVGFTLTAATGYVKANLIGPAETAVTAFIDALPLGAPLPYSRLAQVIYDSALGIANVTALLVNSGTADIGGGAAQVVRASSVVAS